MNKKEKIRFVKSLCKAIEKSVLEDIDRIPEEWDGHELRELIHERAQASRGTLYTNRARRAEFDNDCMINNL